MDQGLEGNLQRAYFAGFIDGVPVLHAFDDMPNRTDRINLEGGKGANLDEMLSLGLPVPPKSTITTAECVAFMGLDTEQEKEDYMNGLDPTIDAQLALIEKATGKKFGDLDNPLFLSVRSGARKSMPGMMDTVLNVGLNDVSVVKLAELTNNERFAYDTYRRHLAMYGDVVLGMCTKEHDPFEHALITLKKKYKLDSDLDLTVDHLKELIGTFKQIYQDKNHGQTVELLKENNPRPILNRSIRAVFESWNSERAVSYRELEGYPDNWGTAVNLQAMVFGNTGPNSATGVAFTRNPATGVNEFYGEWLPNAQGEDVVAGVRTPQPLSLDASLKLAKDMGLSEEERLAKLLSLEEAMPTIYRQLVTIRGTLEQHFNDMADIEFTIEDGILYMLQTRDGKRESPAAIKIGLDFYDRRRIDKKTLLNRVEASKLPALLAPVFDPTELKAAQLDGRYIAKGLAAGSGAASAVIAVTVDAAKDYAARKIHYILVRDDTSPKDFPEMKGSVGILTSTGGLLSHAAIVARQINKPCIVGAKDVKHLGNGTISIKGQIYRDGDYLSLNGFKGDIIQGSLDTTPSEIEEIVRGRLNPEDSQIYQMFTRFMSYVKEHKGLGVRVNADTPEDVAIAVILGAEGIGLTRTEHMFGGDRVDYVRDVIFARDAEGRKESLCHLLPMQKGDFKGIYSALVRDGKPLPATIRLLDPPLHEFLPKDKDDKEAYMKRTGISAEELESKIADHHEFNPMLGHRGCRLGIVLPEIYNMQVRAITEAALETSKENGYQITPEIMIPLVSDVNEFKRSKQNAISTINEVLAEYRGKEGYEKIVDSFQYLIGTMIEVPRATETADDIAREADFFSFGTNDLTQLTYGISRDDAGSFMSYYIDQKIFPEDPFEVLDQKGVGRMVTRATADGKAAYEGLKVGICGEHGGEPKSVMFCHGAGLDYVSCSPFRIPVAMLAAAQANIASPRMAPGR
ncbi:MAG: pyruvate, phosphate dikinase [Nanoarchaeota archaeon]